MKHSIKLTLLVILASMIKLTASTPKIPEHIKKSLGGGVCFTENKGQLTDQFGQVRRDVLYSGSTGNMDFFLMKGGLSYQLGKVEKGKARLQGQVKNYRLDLSWVGANARASIKPSQQLPGHNTYYTTEKSGVKDVRSFSGVEYTDIYEKVSLHFYENKGGLKYDFVVAPGGDYRKIKIRISGAASLRINTSGDLEMLTPLGKITEAAPVVFQEGKRLPAKWVLNGNVISFDVTGADGTKELIIDPAVRAWGTYYGGNSADTMYGCSTDNAGNVYIAGSTASSINIATSGAYQTTHATTWCAFLVKFNSSGVRQWATYYGAGTESGYDCVVNGNGDIYLVGASTGSNSVVASSGAYQQTFGGYSDVMIVKFNSSGSRVWGTYYGGTGEDNTNSCALDASGNLYIAGSSTSTNAIASTGAHQTIYGGHGSNGLGDAFLAKFDPSGNRLWATYYGGDNDDLGYCCTTDASGNVYLSGIAQSTLSSVFSTSLGYQQTISGSADAFLVKFNSSGVRQWGTYYGGTGGENANSCATDYAGNVYIAGISTSTAGVASSGAFQTSKSGGVDSYIAKFTSSGSRIWGTYYGDAGTDEIYNCITDAAGNVFVSGATTSSVGFSTAGSHQTSYGGGTSRDAFISKFSPTGSLLWGTYYGGSLDDFSYFSASCVDSQGRIYMTGGTESTATVAIATSGAHQTTHSGGSSTYESFLVQFTECPPDAPVNISSTQLFCENSIVSLQAAGSGTINWYATPTSTTILYSGTNFTAGVLSVGTYSYYAEAVTCSASVARTEITASVVAGPTVAVSSGTICAGQVFSVLPSGNATSYSITGGTFTVSPTTSTSYTVTGYNAAGCPSSTLAVVDLSVFSNPSISVSTTSILCFGTAGSATAQATGAIGPYNYNWLPGPLTGSIQSTLMAGVYSLSVSDSKLCASTVTLQMVQPAPILPNVAATSTVVCAGGSSTLTVSAVGGNAPYTYSWSSGATGSLAVVNPTISTVYTLTTKDLYQCTAISMFSVNANPLPTVAVNSGSVCSGNVFTLVATGASTYNYSGGSNLVSPATNTTYVVTGTNIFGCISTTTATITVAASPTVGVNSGSICSGQTFTIIPSGANTYSISGGNTLVSPTTNTTYLVTGTSVAGCASTNTVTASVTVVTRPVVGVNSGTICSGNSFTIIPSGAVTYSIAGTSSVVSPAGYTTFAVVGYSSGCASSNTATATVSVNQTPSLMLVASVYTTCSGDAVNLAVSGADTYTWSTGSNSSTIFDTPLTNTVYFVNGGDNTGCSAQQQSLSIKVNPSPTVSIAGPTVICALDTANYTASGAISYIWNTNSNAASMTVAPAFSATYAVVGTNAFGCMGTAVISVNVNQLPAIFISGPQVVCAGSAATLTAAGAATYVWAPAGGSGNPVLVYPTTSTNYTVKGTDNNGCRGYAIHPIVVIPAANVYATVSSSMVCQGATLSVNATGAASYTWSGGLQNNTQFTLSAGGNFTVTGEDGNGCTDTDVVSISVLPSPTISIIATPTPVCAGETVTLTASGAVQYNWTGGSPGSASIVVTPSANSTLAVTGTGNNGCTSTLPVLVDICSGLKEQSGILLGVYPNPNTGSFFVKCSKEASVAIRDELGRIIYGAKVLNEVVEVKGLAKGIYFVQASTATENRVVKVVVME